MLEGPELSPLSIDKWDSTLGFIIDDMSGSPLNIHALLAHNPDFLRAWWPLRMHLVNGGKLNKRSCELVILRVGVNLKSSYEWGAHVVRGLECGLTIEEIERVIKGPSHSGWLEADSLILRAVDELFTQHKITKNLRIELSNYYGKEQIIDLIGLCGMYVFLGGILNTWEPSLEDSVLKHIPVNMLNKF